MFIRQWKSFQHICCLHYSQYSNCTFYLILMCSLHKPQFHKRCGHHFTHTVKSYFATWLHETKNVCKRIRQISHCSMEEFQEACKSKLHWHQIWFFVWQRCSGDACLQCIFIFTVLWLASFWRFSWCQFVFHFVFISRWIQFSYIHITENIYAAYFESC